MVMMPSLCPGGNWGKLGKFIETIQREVHDKAAGVTPRDTETHVSDSWARGNGDLKNEFTNLKCKFNTRFLRTHADEKALIRNFSKYYASIKLDNTTKKIFDIIDEKPNLKEKNWGFIIEV